MNQGKTKQRFKEEEKKTSRGRDVSDVRWPRACCTKRVRALLCAQEKGGEISFMSKIGIHMTYSALCSVPAENL